MGTTLSNIENGGHVIVREILESSLKVKLIEMGLVYGKKIEVLYRAPFGGPMAISIDGYVLSLRKEEANLIDVESENASQL